MAELGFFGGMVSLLAEASGPVSIDRRRDSGPPVVNPEDEQNN